MTDYNIGGNEEENAELRKLNAEVVWTLGYQLITLKEADADSETRPKTLITLITGRSSFA